MKKVLLLLTLILISTNSLLANGELRKKATESPLDTALYLLSIDEGNVDADKLLHAFFQAKRYDEAIRSGDLCSYQSSHLELFARLSNDLLTRGDRANAAKFLDKGMELVRDDGWDSSGAEHILRPLILAGRKDDAFEIVSNRSGDKKAWAMANIGSAVFDQGHAEEALVHFNDAYELRDSFDSDRPYFLSWLAYRYITLDRKDRVLEIIENLKSLARAEEDVDRRESLENIVLLYFKIGEYEQARNLWREYSEADDSLDLRSLLYGLKLANKLEESMPLVKELEERGEPDEIDDIVRLYVHMNDLENAARVAKNLSLENDSYEHQEALMMIADKYVETGKRSAALEILNFAMKRTAAVGEEHPTDASIGASPLTRKVIYLENLRERFLKLQRYDRVAALPSALKTRNFNAKTFIAHNYLELAKAQAKTLPKKELNLLVDRAIKISYDKEDLETFHYKVVSDVVKTYAIIGEKEKAIALLTKTLKETHDKDTYYLDEVLVLLGAASHESKLKMTPALKAVLLDIVAEFDEEQTAGASVSSQP